jgi:hypothetical protein
MSEGKLFIVNPATNDTYEYGIKGNEYTKKLKFKLGITEEPIA